MTHTTNFFSCMSTIVRSSLILFALMMFWIATKTPPCLLTALLHLSKIYPGSVSSEYSMSSFHQVSVTMTLGYLQVNTAFANLVPLSKFKRLRAFNNIRFKFLSQLDGSSKSIFVPL